MSEAKIKRNIRIAPSQWDQISKEADRLGITPSEMIRSAWDQFHNRGTAAERTNRRLRNIEALVKQTIASLKEVLDRMDGKDSASQSSPTETTGQ